MVAAAALGDMILPALVEELMATTSPQALLYFALVDVGVAGALVGALFVLTHGCRRGEEDGRHGPEDECRKLTDSDDEVEEVGGNGYRWTAGTS